MIRDAVILIGRETKQARGVFETHADRLASRLDVDDVTVATYGREPVRELREAFSRVDAETVYAVPMTVAHSHDTTDQVPAALSYLSGTVHYCEPPGASPPVTEAIEEKATALRPAASDVSLVLAAFGSSSKPYHRQVAEYHAARLREGTGYGEVVTCYLLQAPTVDCVRYDAANDRGVVVPLFLTRTAATEERIPAALELDRGGFDYAEPFGEDPRITDAIHAEVAKQRALADDGRPPAASFERKLTRTRRPVAADGEGRKRE